MSRLVIATIIIGTIAVAFWGPQGAPYTPESVSTYKMVPTRAVIPTQPPYVVPEKTSARWSVFLWTLTAGAVVIFVIMPLAVAMKLWIGPFLNEWGAHQIGENGLPRPKTVNAATFLERIDPRKEAKYVTIDPSKMTGPAMGTRLNGKLTHEMGVDTGLSPMERTTIAERALQAGAIGFSSHNQAQAARGQKMGRYEAEIVSGVAAEKKRKAAADAQRAELMLERQRQKALPVLENPSDEPEPVEKPHREAIMTSNAKGFVVGYRDDGLVCKVNLQASIHVAIIGSTGTGKTSSIGLKMIVDSLRHGYHTIILDGMGGDDLGVFKDYAEWYDSTPKRFPFQLRAILTEHNRRLLQTNGDKQAKKNLQPVSVYIEEFNEIWSNMTPEDQEECEPIIKTIIAKGRHTKIHLIFIGQETEDWPKTTLNIKARVVFALGLAEAQRLAEFHAVHLPDNGEFLFKNQRYKAWLWEDEYAKYLPRNGGNGGVKLLEVGSVDQRVDQRRSTVDQRGDQRVINGGFSEVETVIVEKQRSTAGGGGTPQNHQKGTPPAHTVEAVEAVDRSSVPIPIMRLYDRGANWESIGKKYFELFANGTQSSLRKMMSDLSGKPPDSFKREAFKTYHSYSPAGKHYSGGNQP